MQSEQFIRKKMQVSFEERLNSILEDMQRQGLNPRAAVNWLALKWLSEPPAAPLDEAEEAFATWRSVGKWA